MARSWLRLCCERRAECLICHWQCMNVGSCASPEGPGNGSHNSRVAQSSNLDELCDGTYDRSPARRTVQMGYLTLQNLTLPWIPVIIALKCNHGIHLVHYLPLQPAGPEHDSTDLESSFCVPLGDGSRFYCDAGPHLYRIKPGRRSLAHVPRLRRESGFSKAVWTSLPQSCSGLTCRCWIDHRRMYDTDNT
jgi:hypothetical protein